MMQLYGVYNSLGTKRWNGKLMLRCFRQRSKDAERRPLRHGWRKRRIGILGAILAVPLRTGSFNHKLPQPASTQNLQFEC